MSNYPNPFYIRKEALPGIICRVMLLLLCQFSVLVYETKARSLSNSDVADTAAINAALEKARQLVNRPGEIAFDLNAAQALATQALHDSRKGGYSGGEGAACTVLSQIYREKSDRNKGQQFALQAVNLFNSNRQFPVQRADALMELADYYSIYDSAALLQKILLYRDATDLLGKAVPGTLKNADATKFLGDLYMVYHEYDAALYYVQRSLVIYQANHYSQLQDVYSLLGQIYFNQYNRRLAIKYGLLAVNMAEKNKDSSALIIAIYNRLGILYTRMEHDVSAEACFVKAIAYAEKRNDDTRFLLYSNAAQSYIRQHRAAEAIALLEKGIKQYAMGNMHDDYGSLLIFLLGAYVQIGKYRQGFLLQTRIHNLLEAHPDIFGVSTKYNFQYYSYLLFLATGAFEKCEASIHCIEQLNGREHFSTSRASTLVFFRYQLDSARNNLAAALMYYKRYSMMRDSLTKQNYDKDVAGFEIEYEAKRRDIELGAKAEAIKHLQAQSHLQEKALQSRQLTRNLAVLGVVLLGLLLLVLYNRYRYKQQTTLILNKQNESLKQLLLEREWLLKDVNHRVKNNLQIVISLLDAQMADLTDDKALYMIRGSQQRMHAISLIHQKLSLSEKYSSIPMQDYIPELAEFCRQSMAGRSGMKMFTDIEPVLLEVSQAVAIGLIINEAITNACKYAFADGRGNGRIAIRLHTIEDGLVQLTITDNGVGIIDATLLAQSSALGISLIKGLAVQLKGKAEFVSEKGLMVRVTFNRINVVSLQQDDVAAMVV